jgi:hypothetical protein
MPKLKLTGPSFSQNQKPTRFDNTNKLKGNNAKAETYRAFIFTESKAYTMTKVHANAQNLT